MQILSVHMILAMQLLSKYLRPLRSLSNLPNRPFQATYMQRFNPKLGPQ